VTPFAVENYAFGLTAVRLWPFLVATAVGILPGTVLNVWIGVLGWRAAQGEAGIASWALLAVGVIASLILTFWLSRRAKQKMKDASPS
jgi:uncharacterized membrane protein YdjX (TVP38/TMEM64 family)